MKYKKLLAACLLTAALSACNENEERIEPKAPEIEFSVTDDVLNVLVGTPVEFRATIVEGNDISAIWTVDGELVATTPSLTWVFNKLGTSTVHFEASNNLGKVEKDYTVNVAGVPLEITCSLEEGTVESVIGNTLEISVTVTGGDKETVHSWTLDGEVVGDGTLFSHVFTEEEIGTHSLEYRGENIDGMTAQRSWTINVIDLPLELSYTPAGESIDAMVGDNLTFSAKIIHGAGGAAFSWKLNGSEVSTSDSYTYDCPSIGSFMVSCSVTNAIGETADRNWTVNVAEKSERSLLFDNFEGYEIGPGIGSYYIGNVAGGVSVTQVVENPFKTAVNSSSKVLGDMGSIMNPNNSTSGYFKFKVNTMPDGKTEVPDRARYTKVRVKVYIGESGYTPLLQEDNKSTKSTPSIINGIEFDTMNPTLDAWNAAIKTNDWNVFVYDLTSGKYSGEVNNLAQTGQFQFRVFVNFNNQNQKPADIYFDDIEFVE
ncbi:MAG: hypothetical protein J5764_05620 [Bacteroidales bacterium]|nr:hypothetical protein [Bacteroidales bacterium]